MNLFLLSFLFSILIFSSIQIVYGGGSGSEETDKPG